MARILALLLFCACMAGLVRAGEAQPVAADPALEARVVKLAEELRCLVCQNQTLQDSHAPLAIDLKNQVRQMLASGKSEDDVVDYMVARYGDFVLYRPPVKSTTLLLWIGPLLLLAASLFALLRYVKKAAASGDSSRAPGPNVSVAEESPLDASARRRADALLGLSEERP